MLVWQKIRGPINRIGCKKIDLNYIHDWLQKFDIKACDLQREVKYLNDYSFKCTKNCTQCLFCYLQTDVNTNKEKCVVSQFNSITDEFGEQQLRLW